MYYLTYLKVIVSVPGLLPLAPGQSIRDKSQRGRSIDYPAKSFNIAFSGAVTKVTTRIRRATSDGNGGRPRTIPCAASQVFFIFTISSSRLGIRYRKELLVTIMIAGNILAVSKSTHQKPAKKRVMSEKSVGQTTALGLSRFSDVSALGRLIGWDIDFRQLDSGPEDISAQIRVGRNLALARVGFKRSYHQRGSAPSGMLTFGTPLNGSLDWYARPIDSARNHELQSCIRIRLRVTMWFRGRCVLH